MKVFQELLDVRAGEGKLCAGAFLFSFLLGIPQVFTGAAAGALFLSSYSASDLPVIYMITAVLIPALGVVLIRFDKGKLDGILPSILISLVVLAGLIGMLLFFNQIVLTRALVMIWVDVELVLTETLFWLFINQLFHVRQAKRLFSLVSAGSVVALILGGVLIPLILPHTGTEKLLLFSLGGHAASLVCFLFLRKEYAGVAVLRTDTYIPDPDEHSRDPYAELGMLKDPYVRLIFMVVVCEYITHYFIDNAFYERTEFFFSATESIAGFVALVLAANGVFLLGAKFFFAGAVLNRIGIRGGLLGAPALTLSLSLLLGVSGLMGAGTGTALILLVALRTMKSLYINSVYTPAFYALFQPIPVGRRTRVQQASDTVVSQLAGGLAGVVLLSLGFFWRLNAFHIAWMLSIVTLLWLISGNRLNSGYQTAVNAYLEKRGLTGKGVVPDTDSVGSGTPETVKDTEQAVIDTVRRAMKVLCLRRPLTEQSHALVYRALGHEIHKKEKHIFVLLSRVHDPGEIADIWNNLSEGTPEMRSFALESLENFLSGSLRSCLVPLMDEMSDERCLRKLRHLGRCHTYAIEDAVREISDPTGPWTGTWPQLCARYHFDHKTLQPGELRVLERVGILRKAGILTGIAEEDLAGLAPQLSELEFPAGCNIIRKGDEGSSLFIVAEGQVRVHDGDLDFARFGSGDFFGEFAALDPEPRSASVTCLEQSRFLELGQSVLHTFLQERPQAARAVLRVLANRQRASLVKGIPGEDPEIQTRCLNDTDDLHDPHSPHAPHHLRRSISPGLPSGVQETLKEFGLLRGTSSDVLNLLAQKAWLETYTKGQWIEKQESPRSGLFLILRGEVTIERSGKEVIRLGNGDSFGEPAYLDFLPQPVGARARTDLDIIRISRKTVQALIWEEYDVLLRMIQLTIQRLRHLNRLFS
jgi:CRP-like cAMP-binding protein